jgi:two-component system OmpR family response regulator
LGLIIDSMKLLIVEDAEGIVLALYRSLAPNYTIETAGTVGTALNKVNKTFYDAIILDLNLPDGSGLKVCEWVRANGIQTPILVLSGDSETDEKVMLLDSGANDYLVKPFDMDELKARLRVLLREPKAIKNHHRLAVGDLVLDRVRHEVFRDGKVINLRRKEFALLECMMQNCGIALTRATLSNYAWDDEDSSVTNTVDVHIKYLRDKIDRPFATPLIKTVHGLGYKIDASNE